MEPVIEIGGLGGNPIIDKFDKHKRKPLYEGRFVCQAIVRHPNGWIPESPWEWEVGFNAFTLRPGEDQNQTWGNAMENRKVGGFFGGSFQDSCDTHVDFKVTRLFRKGMDLREFQYSIRVRAIDQPRVISVHQRDGLQCSGQPSPPDPPPQPDPPPTPGHDCKWKRAWDQIREILMEE